MMPTSQSPQEPYLNCDDVEAFLAKMRDRLRPARNHAVTREWFTAWRSPSHEELVGAIRREHAPAPCIAPEVNP